MSTFPTAAEARAGSRNNLTIHAEIRAVEQVIYQAIEAGHYSVDVKTSPMTDPLTIDPEHPENLNAGDYFAVLFDDQDNRALREQLDIVQKNFVDLGYSMTPLANPATANNETPTFLWRILW